MTTIVDRTAALSAGTTSDLAQAGAVFNDATRLLDGGLWSTPADSHNQTAYLGTYTTDIQAVANDIAAALANPTAATVNGQTVALSANDTAVLSQIQGQLQTLLTAAPNSIGHGSAAAAAEESLNTTQTTILNEINGDSALHTALANATYTASDGATNTPFQALPVGNDGATELAAAHSGASLADIGSVFNAAADLAIGGLNSSNSAQFTTDFKAVKAGLTAMLDSPTALSTIESGETGQQAATTTLHLQTLLNQTDLQLNSFDHTGSITVAARGTNDNLLDMIDIVQGDTALQAAANGVNASGAAANGFGAMPSFLTGTVTHYQDNQAQTNFWAEFVVGANTINNQLANVANGTTTAPGDISALISEIQNYQKLGSSFSQSQGGVFSARFNNELVDGTLKADSQTAIQGLQGILHGDTGAALTADQVQIQAAGGGFVADAQDVSGNNIPIGGGTYIGAATTIAGATSVAGVAQGTFPAGNGAAGPISLPAGTGANPHSSDPAPVASVHDASMAAVAHDTIGSSHADPGQHYHYLWA